MTDHMDVEAYNKLNLEPFKERLLVGIRLDHTFKTATYRITLESATSISKADFEACFELIAYTSKSDYEQSSIGWRPRAKKAEMKDVDMRYLLVRAEQNSDILGFASFMLTYEAGKEIIYLYEIHLADAARGTGLGKHLMNVVSKIGGNAGVNRLMLTVFVRNSQAAEWYARLGFRLDRSSPGARTLRNGIVKESDYQILTRPIS